MTTNDEPDTIPQLPTAITYIEPEPNERLAAQMVTLVSRCDSVAQLLSTLAMVMDQGFEDQDAAALCRGFAQKMQEHETQKGISSDHETNA